MYPVWLKRSVHFALMQNEPKNQGDKSLVGARYRYATQFRRSFKF